MNYKNKGPPKRSFMMRQTFEIVVFIISYFSQQFTFKNRCIWIVSFDKSF